MTLTGYASPGDDGLAVHHPRVGRDHLQLLGGHGSSLPRPRRGREAAGRELMVGLIESLSAGVPRPLVEIAKLGRTLSKRAADILAYFDRPGTSNGPTEAINGRLEHLRGSALASATSPATSPDLLGTGGFRPGCTLPW